MPIIQDGGRWRSVRTPAERVESAANLVAGLSPKEKAALQKILGEWTTTGRSALANVAADVEWEEQPLPVREWLLNEDLIGETGKDMYPQLREDLAELFEGDYSEAVLTGSTGWGKDFFATTACMRMLYELCCLKDPQRALGLAVGEPIHIVPISRTVASARRVVFGGICKKLALAHWFRGKYEETMEEIRFRKKGIYIVGGASTDAAALGLNTIFSIVDETNFYGEGKVATGSASGKAEDKATMIYNALARRVKNRFRRHGVRGLIMLVSSKRSTKDFTEARIKRAIKENDSSIFVRDYAVWNVHPEPFKDQKWYRCAVSQREGRCKVLEDDREVAPPGSLVFKFPGDFLDEFKADPDGAARDIGGVATDFVGRLFITRRLAVDKMFDKERPSPFKALEWTTGRTMGLQLGALMTLNAHGEPIPACCPQCVRHVHIDMSTNHCATGFVIGHRAGSMKVKRKDHETGAETEEDAALIHIDGVIRIVAPDGGDVDHSEVRGLVYRLISEGFPIRSVSMDQYSAPPNLQMFKQRGLKTAEVGERVAKMKPYLALRQALYEERIVSAYHPVLDRELKELEMAEDGKKVIHPPRGSKDLSDALAGVVYYLSENVRGGGPLGPVRGLSVATSPEAGPQWTNKGDVIWGDEDDDLDDSAPRRNPGKGEDGFSSWIIR